MQCEALSEDRFYFLLTVVKYEGDTAWIYRLGLWSEVNSLFQRPVSASMTVSVGVFAVHSLKKQVWRSEEHWRGRHTILKAAVGCKCYACHSIFGRWHGSRSHTPAKWWKIKRIKIEMLIEDRANNEGVSHLHQQSHSSLCSRRRRGHALLSHTHGAHCVGRHSTPAPLLWILLEHHPRLTQGLSDPTLQHWQQQPTCCFHLSRRQINSSQNKWGMRKVLDKQEEALKKTKNKMMQLTCSPGDEAVRFVLWLLTRGTVRSPVWISLVFRCDSTKRQNVFSLAAFIRSFVR